MAQPKWPNIHGQLQCFWPYLSFSVFCSSSWCSPSISSALSVSTSPFLFYFPFCHKVKGREFHFYISCEKKNGKAYNVIKSRKAMAQPKWPNIQGQLQCFWPYLSFSVFCCSPWCSPSISAALSVATSRCFLYFPYCHMVKGREFHFYIYCG